MASCFAVRSRFWSLSSKFQGGAARIGIIPGKITGNVLPAAPGDSALRTRQSSNRGLWADLTLPARAISSVPAHALPHCAMISS
jgi:hypothetical protein